MKKKMKKASFLSGYEVNFESIRRACINGDLALLEAQDKAAGEKAALIVAINRYSGGDSEMVPLARMIDGDPYKQFNPPNPSVGFRQNQS